MPKRFFEFMTHDERMDCLCYGDWGSYSAGAVLMRRNEPPNGLRVLLHGEAEVRIGPNLLARLEAGDVFGEVSFALEVPASADVLASTPVSVLLMSNTRLERLIDQHPRVAGALYRSLATELARRISLQLAHWKG